MIGSSADRAAGRQIPDIALNELEIFPGFVAYGRLNQVQVFTVASGKIVQTDYPLSRIQQSLHQIRPNKTRRPGD